METLYVKNRTAFRKWLAGNHAEKKEIWVIYYKKHTGKPRIPYDHAVEEAICYGWIDSTVRRIDDERYAQKFTPRKNRSKWNQRNIDRAEEMIRRGKMTRAGKRKFEQRGEYEPRAMNLEIPPDLAKALGRSKKAKSNFENMAPSYRRNYLHWISAAKRPETRKKRLRAVVERARDNLKPGM